MVQLFGIYSKKQGIKLLEKLQRKATNIVLFIRNKNYKVRLLGLTSSENCRMDFDLKKIYKIKKNLTGSIGFIHLLSF